MKHKQEPKRRKRPPVERTEPDRSLSGWVRSTVNSSRSSISNEARNSGESAQPSDPREVGYDTINSAYRLIDEYLRRGQKMAEDLWLPNESNGAGGPFNAPARFMRAMGDMTMAWVEVMQEWTDAPTESRVGGEPFTAGKPRPDRPNGAGPPSKANGRAASLKVLVKSRGLVEVSVHLADLCNPSSLTASELRPFSGNARPIENVELDASGDTPVLRIVVPERQPPGTYNGLLLERDTHRPRGTVSVVVS